MKLVPTTWLAIFVVGAFCHFSQRCVDAVAPSSPNSMSFQKPELSMSTLPTVLASWERVDRMKDKMEVEKKSGLDSKEDSFDFIVVGAGTAGSIVAARLSQHFSVLLLEAGGQPHPTHDNPGMAMIMTKHSETDWMYTSVVQNETCLLCPDHKYVLSAGKGLGGSGNLNYLNKMYEGTFHDYSEWMAITGDPTWGYYQLQPYFKIVRDYMIKKDGDNTPFRSTYKAMVKPNPHLKVEKFSHVHKVLLNDSNHAYGVEYERHGNTKQAFASKEVIISSGTFGSPQILMRSGIGPQSILESVQIPTKVDLPVGNNFQDHLAIPLGPFFTANITKALKATSRADVMESWNVTDILNMPLINYNHNGDFSREMSHLFGIREALFTQYMASSKTSKKSSGGESMFINVSLKKPTSTGQVTIVGHDPKLYPLINPNYLSLASNHHHTFNPNPLSDRQRLIEALEETVRRMENSSNISARFTKGSVPGCENHIFRGYGYWDCYIRHFSMSFSHGVGTCSFGDASSPTTVVDSKLNVVGVPGLRVIDASVIPVIPSTFPFHTVAVIGEKGAAMIINKYKPESHSTAVPTVFKRSDSKKEEYSGFKIKKLAAQPTTTHKPQVFATGKLWQKADQIYQTVHVAGSSLSDEDLLPPGEGPTKDPNPSYFPVHPLAGKLIFHPVIPQEPFNLFSKLKNWNWNFFNQFKQ